MIYPSLPEYPNNKVVTVAKLVQPSRGESYTYVLNVDRSKSVWFPDKSVQFTFAKFKTEDYLANFNGRLKSLRDRINNLKNTFPVSLRYVSSNKTYVFERPPFSNTFRYIPMKASNARRTVRQPVQLTVWFPWSIYVFPLSSDDYYNQSSENPYPFGDPAIYFSSSKIYSMDQEIYVAPLPNIFSDGRVCMGFAKNQIINDWNDLSQVKSPNYNDAFNICINSLFSGGWNNDILPSSSIPKVMSYNNSLRLLPNVDAIKKNSEYSSRISSPSKSNHFLNYLKIWSEMTLEEVLEAYSHEDYSPNHSLTLDQAVNSKLALPNSFSNVFSMIHRDPAVQISYSNSIYVNTFNDSPIDGNKEYPDSPRSQEEYYEFLEALIERLENPSKDESDNSATKVYYV